MDNANWRNPDWKYRPSHDTDIRKTFKRIWRERAQELKERQLEPPQRRWTDPLQPEDE